MPLKFPEHCLFICHGALFRRNTQVEPGPRYVFSGRGLYPICHSGLGTACHPASFMEQETTDLTLLYLLSCKIKKKKKIQLMFNMTALYHNKNGEDIAKFNE